MTHGLGSSKVHIWRLTRPSRPSPEASLLFESDPRLWSETNGLIFALTSQ